ncbi:uncharacterized protein LOC101848672 [Aplysia californica]|uniref:Uncharacterized protein LOC101848672 n=1 Tax=Aplysia californica TaxID=6500 RepID=A0ABM1VWX0_APLCA|nr:uncharacterized protein LOC101848672 [Aplysia californica]
MSSISIRRALLSDKHAVTHEISKAWGDMDYFSDLYDEFISGPGCMGHVAVDGTDVVGITCGIVADGGQMVCTRGSKVKDSHQGRGIYMSILDAMNREIKQTTDVTWESVSVVKATAERINKSYTQRKSFREIMRLYDSRTQR